MKSLDIVQHIRELIAEQDFVVIPGFGGFVGKYCSAKIHPVTHLFSPPNKSIVFNKSLTTDDGLLVNKIVEVESVSHEEAQNDVVRFARDLTEKLDNNETIQLSHIGRIYKDIENRIRFIQLEDEPFLPASFGLPSFEAPPVLRSKIVDTGTAIKEIEDTERHKRRITPFIWAAAAFLILIAVVGSYFVSPVVKNKANEIFGWKALDTTHVVVAKDGQKVFEDNFPVHLKNLKKELFPGVPEEVMNPYKVEADHNLPKGYFVIVGSFSKASNAQKLYHKLQKEGMNAYVFPKASNGFVRTGVFVSKDNVFEVSQALHDLRTNYRPDAWIVKNLGAKE